MAIFKKGDMWSVYDKVHLFCITSNSTIRNDGKLVMGKGIAKQGKDKFPGIDREFGNMIIDGSAYALMISSYISDRKIALFQVKYHWTDNADLELIQESSVDLFRFITGWPDCKVALNFPGIGYGGLDRSEVLPIISLLPNNVQIWEY